MTLLVFPAFADSWSWTYSSSNTTISKSPMSTGTVTVNSVTWNLTSESDMVVAKDGTWKGLQLNGNSNKKAYFSKHFTFTTDYFKDKKITEIKYSVGAKNAGMTVKLLNGTTELKSDAINASTNSASKKQQLTWTGSAICSESLSFDFSSETTPNYSSYWGDLSITFTSNEDPATPITLAWEVAGLTADGLTMTVGDEPVQLMVSATDNETGAAVNSFGVAFTSGNTAAATIDIVNSKVNAVAEGDAVITASIDDSKYTADPISFTLHVNAKPVACDKPVAKVGDKVIVDESTVFVDDQITLTSTEGAEILYILSRENQTNEEFVKYTGPFTINTPGMAQIQAVASKEGCLDSEELNILFNVVKHEADVKFSADAATIYMDAVDEFQQPTVTNPHNLNLVGYVIEPEEVATIDEATGAITPLTEGTATVTAMYEGNDIYKDAEITYTLTVVAEKPLAAPVFTPAGGNVKIGSKVVITCPTEGASIKYALNADDNYLDYPEGGIEMTEAGEVTIYAYSVSGSKQSSTVSATFTVKEKSGIEYVLSKNKEEVTFSCEGAAKMFVRSYEIDGTSTEETVEGASVTTACNSMYAVFEVEAFDASDASIGSDRISLLADLNATIADRGDAWYRVNAIDELQEGVDYIIVSHFPQAKATVRDVYMTNKYSENSSGQGRIELGALTDGELIDNDAVLTLDAAATHADAAILNLESDGNGKWALKIKNVVIGGKEVERYLTASAITNKNSVNLTEIPEAADYATVLPGPGTTDYPALMGAMRFDFADSDATSKFLRFNAGINGTTGIPQDAMFRCYNTDSGVDHMRPLYLYARMTQAPSEVPDYTAMAMYNGEALTQELSKRTADGEETEFLCHYDKLPNLAAGKISVKVIGFDGKAKILYPKPRTAEVTVAKVASKPNEPTGTMTLVKETHYDLAVDGNTTTVPDELKNHYFEIEVQPFKFTRIAAFNVPTAIEDIDIDDAETVEDADADARYYNLQGVEVKNPAHGIYIRVSNGKATKIMK